MNTIKGILLGISKVVLPLLAGIMCISVLLIAGMSITYLSITGLIAITLYCLVPKTWGVIPLSVCVIAGCLYFYMLIADTDMVSGVADFYIECGLLFV